MEWESRSPKWKMSAKRDAQLHHIAAGVITDGRLLRPQLDSHALRRRLPAPARLRRDRFQSHRCALHHGREDRYCCESRVRCPCGLRWLGGAFEWWRSSSSPAKATPKNPNPDWQPKSFAQKLLSPANTSTPAKHRAAAFRKQSREEKGRRRGICWVHDKPESRLCDNALSASLFRLRVEIMDLANTGKRKTPTVLILHSTRSWSGRCYAP